MTKRRSLNRSSAARKILAAAVAIKLQQKIEAVFDELEPIRKKAGLPKREARLMLLHIMRKQAPGVFDEVEDALRGKGR